MNLPQRRNRLPKPGLQLKLIGVFLALGMACTLVQFALLSRAATKLALTLPEGRTLLGPVGDLLITQLAIAMALLVPLTVVIGAVVTFRVAGPIYHFETHLRALLAGRNPGTLKIREGDELGELCELLNQVLEGRRVASEDTRPALGDDAVANDAIIRSERQALGVRRKRAATYSR